MKMEELDRIITLAINAHHSPASDAFWIFMSSSKWWYLLYAALITLMFWRLGWKKGLVMLAATALTILLTDQCCNLIKNSVCRLRPGNDPEMLARGLYLPIAASTKHIYGFLSAHSANSFAVVVLTSAFLHTDKRLTLKGSRNPSWLIYLIVMVLWASLVAISRVFLARHFVGDILAGAALGCIIAAATAYAAMRLYDRFASSGHFLKIE